MTRPLLLILLILVFAGCDTQPDRPLTLAERVAGTWEMARVEDGRVVVTQDFEATVGAVTFEFESVGCCAAHAAYRLTIVRPDGEVHEVMERYRVNDNPETPNYFAVFTGRPLEDILFIYDLDSPSDELTLTVDGVTEELQDALGALGITYPFLRSVTFELRRR